MGVCCVLNDLLKMVQEGIQAQDPTIIGILVALAVVFLTILLYVVFGGSNKRRGVLLAGLCDGGKTLIFSQLVHGRFIQTHTSIKENSGVYTLTKNKSGSLRLVDLPGHERLRLQKLDEHKALARGVIFVIDSLTFQKEIKDVAGYLYNLLTDRVISSNCPPVLIACNKQDATLAKGAKVIQAQLEKEMNTLRVTRSAALEATDNTGNNNSFLGKRNKDFEFSDLKSFKIQFVECNARGKSEQDSANLEPVIDWIHKIA